MTNYDFRIQASRWQYHKCILFLDVALNFDLLVTFTCIHVKQATDGSSELYNIIKW